MQQNLLPIPAPRPTGRKPRLAVARALAAQHDRWPLWAPVALAIGIATYFMLSAEPPLWAGPAATVLAATLAAALRHSPPARIALAGVALACLGFAAAGVRTATLDTVMLADEHGPAQVAGRVVAVEARPGGAMRVTLEALDIARMRADTVPGRVRVVLRGTQPDIAAGDWLEMTAKLAPPAAPAAPGAFDFQRRAWFDGLGAVGFAYGAARVIEEGRRPLLDPAGALDRLRNDLAARVRGHVGGEAGAVASALMTGMRGAIPEPVMEDIRAAGLAHLLAISGLHVGLVAGTLFFGLRALLALWPAVALRYPIKKWAAVAAVLGAFAYGLLAGATVPTVRAVLMVSMVLIGVIADREAVSLRLVAWAATVILLVQPEVLLGPSFQMSFAAVTALVAFYEAWRSAGLRQAARSGRVSAWIAVPGSYGGGVLATTVIASLATAPFAVYHFNAVAAYGLVANMVAVPVTALWTMPAAVLAFLLMPLGLEAPALWAVGAGVEAVLWAARGVAGWPGAMVHFASPPPAALGLVALGGVWLCLWRGRGRLVGLAGLAVGVATAALVRPPDLLVDDTGALMAVRAEDGRYHVSTRIQGRFARETWLRRAGVDPGAAQVPRWPAAGRGTMDGLTCDGLGCVWQVGAERVALVRDPLALAEDCRMATVIVAAVPVRRDCPEPRLVIDRFALWRDGAHAFWFDPGWVRIETVRASRGARPWTVSPRR